MFHPLNIWHQHISNFFFKALTELHCQVFGSNSNSYLLSKEEEKNEELLPMIHIQPFHTN